MKKPALDREENHLVKATLIINGAEIHEVPCKIYLPERTHEKPYFVLKPTEVDSVRMACSHSVQFKASIFGFDKKIQTTIEAPEVYFSGCSTKHWGDDISESTVPGEPQHLHVIHHLKRSKRQGKTQLTFWISPNEFLTPLMSCTTSYTGEVKFNHIHNLEFTIRNGVKLVFEKHFNSKKANNGDFVQWSYLVACVKLDVPAIDVETLRNNFLQYIDDFLLIASLALRKRTARLGWTATDKVSHTTYYRGNYTFPDCSEKGDSCDGLAKFQSAEKFMETCYANFSVFENKLALRNALCSVVPLTPHTIETSFLHKFAGLETLVLEFKRREKLEFVLEKAEWKFLKAYLEKCIKASIEPKLNCNQRKSIYNKLGELNRISLKEAFDIFCQKYGIYLSDLWPVFGENGNVGLVEIRNKLIHGDPFSTDLIDALVVANDHLQFTLERVIVRVLGWDIAETNVAPTYLQMNLHSMKKLSSERARLSEYLVSSII